MSDGIDIQLDKACKKLYKKKEYSSSNQACSNLVRYNFLHITALLNKAEQLVFTSILIVKRLKRSGKPIPGLMRTTPGWE